ncbi:DDE-type integrase/transposase/recombinase [Erwinia persicina]|uniref:IS6 family transposase n=1 Tax=Erwinia persicina TaxID=55211 RepID=A0A4U3EQE5_9GAMM|nr:DDE-type integrase/transposase/recombinase [Erwinia persicina]MBD8109102.1 IS6 family transposase [Erwinia persicina]MBD8170201.1 IS6 family transposase [Erwinia persicina]MBD8212226.1 IS6 family transposase [Erwinia persicina]TKJ82648.1 IS6 family transposase [Erwinia persicina]
MSLIQKAFKRLHYPADIIAQCVRWVIRLVPLLDKAFRRHKRSVGRRWRMDETDIRVRGKWKYLYRAVDTGGQNIDFLLSAKRDAAALATLNAGKSDEESITIRQSKYLNNLIEQDHLNIKRRTRAMLGFKSFRRARALLAGIELVHMIRKGQYQNPAGDGISPAGF